MSCVSSERLMQKGTRRYRRRVKTDTALYCGSGHHHTTPCTRTTEDGSHEATVEYIAFLKDKMHGYIELNCSQKMRDQFTYTGEYEFVSHRISLSLLVEGLKKRITYLEKSIDVHSSHPDISDSDELCPSPPKWGGWITTYLAPTTHREPPPPPLCDDVVHVLPEPPPVPPSQRVPRATTIRSQSFRVPNSVPLFRTCPSCIRSVP